MNTTRLKTLYSFMLALPNHVVDMDSWRRLEDEDNVKVSNKKLREAIENTDCGTAACALGWACAIPEFKKSGLEYKKEQRGHWRPEYDGSAGFEAAAEFFGITYENAHQLFQSVDDPDEVPSHKYEFLIRLREFLYEHGEIDTLEYKKMLIEELQKQVAEGAY